MKEGTVHGNSTILGLSLLCKGLHVYLPLEMPVRLGCISLATHMEQCFNFKDPSQASTVLWLYWPEEDPSGLNNCCIDEICDSRPFDRRPVGQVCAVKRLIHFAPDF